jgi:hypothetical protein
MRVPVLSQSVGLYAAQNLEQKQLGLLLVPLPPVQNTKTVRKSQNIFQNVLQFTRTHCIRLKTEEYNII